MCVFCFQPGVSCLLISATSVRNTPQPGSLTQSSVHALGSGMAAAAATPTALERNMNVSRHVGTSVSPDCTQADRSTSVDPLTSAINRMLCVLLPTKVLCGRADNTPSATAVHAQTLSAHGHAYTCMYVGDKGHSKSDALLLTCQYFLLSDRTRRPVRSPHHCSTAQLSPL